MNAKQAKNILLSDYLSSLGFNPCSQQRDNLWYKSPFREERHPSFKVSQSKNLWYDFGMGKGGNIIDFVMEYYHIKDLSYALHIMEERKPSIQPVSFSFDQQSSVPSFEEMKIRSLNNPALLSYLTKRNINPNIAAKYCQEIYYKRSDKWYFALGFKNQSDGYELRNKYYKGSIAPKDMTFIQHNNSQCFLFEGFLDFLSFMTLKEKNKPHLPEHAEPDYLILNSLSNLNRALIVLRKYEKISCFFDNDNAGKEAIERIKNCIPKDVSDQSIHYKEYKDLNDYLCGKKISPSIRHSQHPSKGKGRKPKF